jgi:signal transduction histidine kinase
MTARLESTYESESAAINASRIPRACLVLVLVIAGTGAVELVYRPHLIGTWWRFFAAETAIILLPLVFRRALVRRRRFEAVVATSWIAVVALMHLFALTTPLSTVVIACGVICIMAGASLLAWWSTATQAWLVVASCLITSTTVVVRGEGDIETTLTLFAVFAGGVISLQGNRYFEIHRRAILREALRSDEEAAISRALETFAKEINRGLSDEGVEDRVAALARAALSSDWTLVLQAEEPGGLVRIVGGDGTFPTALDNLKALEISPGELPLGDVGDEARVAAGWSERISLLLRRDWHSEAVVAPLRHRDAALGVLVAGFRASRSPDLHLMSGVAQHAAIAIANSRMMDELRRASAMKSEFLATMSHELRTPLHVIMGYTEMLGDILDEGGDPEVLQILRRLEQNEKTLTDLIEGTLDAHRLEAGRTVVKPIRFESKMLLEQIQMDTRWLPRTPGVQLRWDLPERSVTMDTDPTKLKVVAKNLIGNALKFTKRGSVRVRAALDGDGETLELAIGDSGSRHPGARDPAHFRDVPPGESDRLGSGPGRRRAGPVHRSRIRRPTRWRGPRRAERPRRRRVPRLACRCGYRRRRHPPNSSWRRVENGSLPLPTNHSLPAGIPLPAWMLSPAPPSPPGLSPA